MPELRPCAVAQQSRRSTNGPSRRRQDGRNASGLLRVHALFKYLGTRPGGMGVATADGGGNEARRSSSDTDRHALHYAATCGAVRRPEGKRLARDERRRKGTQRDTRRSAQDRRPARDAMPEREAVPRVLHRSSAARRLRRGAGAVEMPPLQTPLHARAYERNLSPANALRRSRNFAR